MKENPGAALSMDYKTMENKKYMDMQKMESFLATENPLSAMIAAGWTPSDLIAAGWTPSALIAAGWTPSDLKAAGWTPSGLIAAGCMPSALIALRAAGCTQIEIDAAKKEWDEIPLIPKLYTKLLADIEAGLRMHDQRAFGPNCDPETNLCRTPMCTAGHLVNMAGNIGYALKNKYGWAMAARIIHMKNRPDIQPQNSMDIPNKLALSYIRERAKEEAEQCALQD